MPGATEKHVNVHKHSGTADGSCIQTLSCHNFYVLILFTFSFKQENVPGKMSRKFGQFDLAQLRASRDQLKWFTNDQGADVNVN